MATQLTLNDGSLNSAGALALKTNGTTQAINITTGQQVEFNDGSDSAPSITNTGDTNTGIFFPAADTVGITTGGTERARIDSSGNLGLGVTPSAWTSIKALQVVNASFGGLGGGNYSAANAYYDGTNWKYITSNYATLYQQSGNTGDGVHKWNIAASGTAGNAITFTQAMTLDASGNLGIGTTSPAARLDITGTDNSQTTLYSRVYSNNRSVNLGFGYQRVETNGDLSIVANGFTAFSNNGSERARIDSSGRMLLNTTTVGAGGGGSTILSAVSLSGQDAVFIKCNSASAGNLPLGCWNDAGTGDNALLYFYTNATISYKGGIDYNRTGGLVRYNTSSDATLKNIIGDADGSKSIDILKSTRIREYSWKEDETNKPQIGVIAQELYETYKGAVSVGGDKVTVDADGNETTQYVPWAVDKTAFTFHLIAGWQAHERIIQEQQAIIQSLTARITALESA